MTYPYIDCVWFGSDENDRIAAFVTGGQGPIPVSAVPLVGNPTTPENEFLSLPKLGEGLMLVDYKNTSSFLALAQRGAYVFDWTDVHQIAKNERNSYQLVSVPTDPVQLVSLPSNLVEAMGIISLRSLDFLQNSRLDVTKFVECLKLT